MVKRFKTVLLISALFIAMVVGAMLLTACDKSAERQERMPPPLPVVEFANEQLTIYPIDGAEYRVDGGEWQLNNIFPAQRYTNYFVEVRYAQTNTTLASTSSGIHYFTIGLDGLGTIKNPYLIKTPADMEAMRYASSSAYLLANDIDFENAELTPIGNAEHPFTGNFYGGLHTIKNVALKEASEVGLFGVATSLAQFSSVTLQNFTFSGSASYAGTLVGRGTDITLHSITVKDTIFTLTNTDISGLLIGSLEGVGLVVGCKIDGKITVEGDIQTRVGGMAGRILGARNYTPADIKSNTVVLSLIANVDHNLLAGGLFGSADHIAVSQTNSYLLSDLQGLSVFAGGCSATANSFSADQSVSYINGEITASIAYVGGMVGYSDGGISISNCAITSRANLTVTQTSWLGGVIGKGSILAEDSQSYLYTYSNTVGSSSDFFVGGVAGEAGLVRVDGFASSLELEIIHHGDDIAIGGIAGYCKDIEVAKATVVGNVDLSCFYLLTQTTAVGGFVGTLVPIAGTGVESYYLSLHNSLSLLQVFTQSHAFVGGFVGRAGQSVIDWLDSYYCLDYVEFALGDDTISEGGKTLEEIEQM